MTLDILTPKGQLSVGQEAEAVALWTLHYPHIDYCETPKGEAAVVDAILVMRGQVIGVVETKCRSDVTREFFARAWKSEWLISWDKIERCVRVASALRVPFVGFMYLVDEQVLYIQNWTPDDYCVAIRREYTPTRETTNSDNVVIRDNAFIDMRKARVLVAGPVLPASLSWDEVLERF